VKVFLKLPDSCQRYERTVACFLTHTVFYQIEMPSSVNDCRLRLR